MPSYDDTFAALWSRIREMESQIANMGNAPAPPFGRDAAIGGDPYKKYAKIATGQSLGAGSSCTVDVYYWNGSAWTDSTKDETVYAPPLLSSGSVAQGKWVRIWFNRESDRWEVDMYEC